MMIMVKCPNCKMEITRPTKTWKYDQFSVQAYSCNNCGTQFREYTKDGNHAFMLKLKKGKGFVKV